MNLSDQTFSALLLFSMCLTFCRKHQKKKPLSRETSHITASLPPLSSWMNLNITSKKDEELAAVVSAPPASPRDIMIHGIRLAAEMVGNIFNS